MTVYRNIFFNDQKKYIQITKRSKNIGLKESYKNSLRFNFSVSSIGVANRWSVSARSGIFDQDNPTSYYTTNKANIDYDKHKSTQNTSKNKSEFSCKACLLDVINYFLKEILLITEHGVLL